MEKQLKGRGFLRITGILMIIAGAVLIVVCCMIALIHAIFEIIASSTGGEGLTLGVLLIVGAIIALVGGIVELVAGIVGTRNASRPERYKRCIVWGIIVLVLNIISLVYSLFSGETQRWMILVTAIFGILIPILFIIGALINRNASLKGATSVEWARERLADAEKKYEIQKVKDAERAERQEAKRVKQEERAEAKAERAEAKAARAEAKAAKEAAREAAKAETFSAPVNEYSQPQAPVYTPPVTPEQTLADADPVAPSAASSFAEPSISVEPAISASNPAGEEAPGVSAAETVIEPAAESEPVPPFHKFSE